MRKVSTSAVSTRMGSSRQNEPFLRLDNRCRCAVGPRESLGSSPRAGSVERARWATSSGYRQATDTGGSGRGRCLTLLLDLRCLTSEIPEVVQLGAPDITASDHLYLGDVRGMDRERALHTHAEGHLAYGESFPPSPRMTAPWKICTRWRDPSMTRTCTLSVSPGRKSGMSVRNDFASRASRVFIAKSILVFKCCARSGAPR